ncbi:MAG: DNA-3-methyladenine glycosylase I [Cyclobacteriaceae bacterium]
MSAPVRCAWSLKAPLYLDYHDQEWGRPVYDDRRLFEMLALSGVQAGLSWLTVLKKRENYREAFDQFDPEKVADYDEEKIVELLQNTGIVRNRQKIQSAIVNAQACLKVRTEFSTFSEYLWQFTNQQVIYNHPEEGDKSPTISPESEQMSQDLRQRGFSFVGPTICYAFMQSVGMINDYIETCWCKYAT